MKAIITNLNSVAEVEVNYKSKINKKDRIKITNPEQSVEALRNVWSDKMEYIEEFVLLLLNRANEAIGWIRISQGGISGTIVDQRVIFQIALKCNASAIIVCHNHPSGQTKPSSADIAITKKIKEGGIILDIALLDHIILTPESYLSMADDGLL